VRADRDRLADIIHAISLIERYARRGRAGFERDELLQVWVIHHLAIIGEAAARLSPALRQDHPEVPWSGIIGMRNVLVHGYFSVDLEEAWGTVEWRLPTLRDQVESILRGLGETGSGVSEDLRPYTLTA
jgi:uncharacterized protein with HEPN domain